MRAEAGSDGNFSLTRSLCEGFCGIYLQWVDADSCLTTTAVQLP